MWFQIQTNCIFYKLHKYFFSYRSAWYHALDVFGTAVLGVGLLWLLYKYFFLSSQGIYNIKFWIYDINSYMEILKYLV